MKQNAALQEIPMATLAKQMGQDMEEAYALFAHTLEEASKDVSEDADE